MKSKEIRDLNREEQQQKLDELRAELFNLRFQHAIGQLDNTQKMKQTKRTIARVQTIMRQGAH